MGGAVEVVVEEVEVEVVVVGGTVEVVEVEVVVELEPTRCVEWRGELAEPALLCGAAC